MLRRPDPKAFPGKPVLGVDPLDIVREVNLLPEEGRMSGKVQPKKIRKKPAR
jgi:hypothetical protein